MPAKQSQTAETPIETRAQTKTSQPAQTLVIGRIVHFVTADGSERAAIVTRVYDESGPSPEKPLGTVDLAVFTTAEEHGKQGAVYGYGSASYDAAGTQPNTWHWPAEGTAHPEVRIPTTSSSDAADDASEAGAPLTNTGAAGAAAAQQPW